MAFFGLFRQFHLVTLHIYKWPFYFSPGPPEFTEELHMRQETDGVLLESYLIYEPEHQATWFKDGEALLGALDFDEKYQVSFNLQGRKHCTYF